MCGVRPGVTNTAVLVNPGAGGARGRRQRDEVLQLARAHGLACAAAASPTEVLVALRELAAAAPEWLVVDGGDGTVGLVVAALRADERIFEREPGLILLRGGSTNMIHQEVGWRGAPAPALRQVLVGGQRGRTRERAPLAVRADKGGPERFGFFWAGGALAQVLQEAQADAVAHPLARLGRLLRGSAQLLLRRGPFAAKRVAAGVAGEPGDVPARFATAPVASLGTRSQGELPVFSFVTSLRQWMFWFSGPPGAAKGLTQVVLKPGYRRWALVAFFLGGGRVAAWMRDDFDLSVTETLSLCSDFPWVLDGEFFTAESGSCDLHFRRAAPIRFWIDG